MKINYKEYLKSDYWLGIREQVYKRDGYKCRLCNSSTDICVHHRTYKNLENEKLNDLITLCKKCHEDYHKTKRKNTIQKAKEFEEQTKEENRNNMTLYYCEYMEKYKNELKIIKKHISKYNYILYEDFLKIVKENTKSKSVLWRKNFIAFLMSYYLLFHLKNYNKELAHKYNLPYNANGRHKAILVDSLQFRFENNLQIINHNYCYIGVTYLGKAP